MDRKNALIPITFGHFPAVTKTFMALILSICICGCFGYRPDLPPTARVTGTVTLDGAPLPNATVQFVPDSSSGPAGAAAIGYTDEQGKYELVTATVKGAIVGRHRVTVVARAQPQGDWDTLPALTSPQRYSDLDTSGLAFEVESGGTNNIDIFLTTEPSDP